MPEHPNDIQMFRQHVNSMFYCEYRSSPRDLFQFILYSALPEDTVYMGTETVHTSAERLAQSPRSTSSQHFPF